MVKCRSQEDPEKICWLNFVQRLILLRRLRGERLPVSFNHIHSVKGSRLKMILLVKPSVHRDFELYDIPLSLVSSLSEK